MKNRYSRRKTGVRNAHRAEPEVRKKEVAKAEAALKIYDFVEWLDPFVNVPGTVTNVDLDPCDSTALDDIKLEEDDELENDKDNEDDSEENDVDVNRDRNGNDDDDKEYTTTTTTTNIQRLYDKEYSGVNNNDADVINATSIPLEENSSVEDRVFEELKKACQTSPPLKKKMPDSDGSSFYKKARLSVEDELLATINKRLQEKAKEKRERRAPVVVAAASEDAEDIFGRMVAQKLRSLSRRRRNELEYEINSAIFKKCCEEEDDKAEKGRQEQTARVQRLQSYQRHQQPLIGISEGSVTQGNGSYAKAIANNDSRSVPTTVVSTSSHSANPNSKTSEQLSYGTAGKYHLLLASSI